MKELKVLLRSGGGSSGEGRSFQLGATNLDFFFSPECWIREPQLTMGMVFQLPFPPLQFSWKLSPFAPDVQKVRECLKFFIFFKSLSPISLDG